MDSMLPSHKAQPLGAKLPANRRISPTKGVGMSASCSVPAGEDALQRDDEVQRQVGLHVGMWLALARGLDGLGAEVLRRPAVGVDVASTSPLGGGVGADGGGGVGHVAQCVEGMGVLWQLVGGERVAFLADARAQWQGGAAMHGAATPQIRQAERGAPVPAVGGAKDGEQGLVLVDGQQLPMAEGPAFGREGETAQRDFAEVGLQHGASRRCQAVVRRRSRPAASRPPSTNAQVSGSGTGAVCRAMRMSAKLLLSPLPRSRKRSPSRLTATVSLAVRRIQLLAVRAGRLAMPTVPDAPKPSLKPRVRPTMFWPAPARPLKEKVAGTPAAPRKPAPPSEARGATRS